MNTIALRNVAAALTVLLAVSACGGGGENLAGGGTGGTGVSFGTVTDFGSVIVNGGHLDDSVASVMLDDNPGSGPHGGLKKGMVVKVSGTFSGNTGTATSIEFRDNLEGPVCSQLTTNGITTLRVLGQTVIRDATTIVDNNATINVGDIVEVSGLPDEQERIIASFIEKKTQQTAVIEVKGRIGSMNTNTTTFTINNLVVNYATAVIDNSIPGGQLAVGQFVEVKGTAFACNNPAGTDTLTATRVELEPQGAGAIPAGNRAEIEGFITAVNAGGFMIGNQQVATNGNTRFLPEDFGAADLVVGAKVEAEGTLAGGVLTATKISFRQNVKLESTVATISGNSPTFSFTLAGLPGITITTNSNTDFRDPVALNAHLRVRGIEGPNNTILATRIDDRGNSTDVFLQGPVDAVSDPNITILGVTVNTSPGNFQFEDVNDVVIPRATFFGLVRPGTLVKIKGDLSGNVVTWDEAELED